MRKFLTLLFAFWVVTYSGQKVAGPFTLLSDCQEMAKIMQKKFFNISSICKAE